MTTREGPALSPADARALIVRLLPPAVTDRDGWATDLYAALSSMEIAPTAENICSVVAVTEQESGFRADPEVAGLSKIAWREIDAQAQEAGIPRSVVHTVLRLPSSNGKSYGARIDAARTERDLSDTFEDLIARVPMGRTFLANRNPVRTGGPMQVSIAFAQEHAERRPYPYVADGNLRSEVFTRRGGLYFGIAHLLDYPAPYDAPLYRFADFNAGHYASRNAAFQNALSVATGIPLDLDGDLVRIGGSRDAPGTTERAARVLARRLDMRESAIRDDLEEGRSRDFAKSRLYERVFALADRAQGRPVPRATVPRIQLKSPKITRKLTTEWFATRVQERHQRCMARSQPKPAG